MNSKLQIYSTKHELAIAAVDRITDVFSSNIEEKGVCYAAMTGAAEASFVYDLLATPPYCDRVQWGKMHIFLLDELFDCGKATGVHLSNLTELLFANVQIPPKNIHSVKNKLSMDDALEEYRRSLSFQLARNAQKFDFVFFTPTESDVYFENVENVTKHLDSKAPVVLLNQNYMKTATDFLALFSGSEIEELAAKFANLHLEQSRRMSLFMDKEAAGKLPQASNFLTKPSLPSFEQ